MSVCLSGKSVIQLWTSSGAISFRSYITVVSPLNAHDQVDPKTIIKKNSRQRYSCLEVKLRQPDSGLELLESCLGQKRYHFYKPFIEKRYPFHIPTLGSLVLIFM